MNFDQELQALRQHPHFCRHCKRISQFTFQVAKNTSKGQYQGYVCPDCQNFKYAKFVPYRSQAALERIWDKDYRHFDRA